MEKLVNGPLKSDGHERIANIIGKNISLWEKQDLMERLSLTVANLNVINLRLN